MICSGSNLLDFPPDNFLRRHTRTLTPDSSRRTMIHSCQDDIIMRADFHGNSQEIRDLSDRRGLPELTWGHSIAPIPWTVMINTDNLYPGRKRDGMAFNEDDLPNPIT